MGLYSLYCVLSPQSLKIIYISSGQDGAIILIGTLKFSKPPVSRLFFNVCEACTTLEKAIAMKSGISQQRLKDPCTSRAMLAFGTQRELVKNILHSFCHVIQTSASRLRQQPAITFPKTHLLFSFKKSFVNAVSIWCTNNCSLPVACIYSARQSCGAGTPAPGEQRRQQA